MTDQTTPLRDRIAAAALTAVEAALGDALVPAARAEALAGIAAVLPAPADRTAVLREAADELDARMKRFFIEWPDEPRNSPYALGQKDAARELRRMADETATTETQARRGDAFEAWLKAQRDRYDRHGERSEFWHEFDRALDEYRLHADLGTPLDGHVCEAKVVGDCECLEQPAAGARQDGSAS